MEYLTKLFSYDRWATTEYFRALAAEPQPEPRAIRLLSHIVAAQMLWMDRIRKRNARAPVWPEWSLESAERHWNESAQEWREFVAKLDATEAAITVAYQNSKGEHWESTVEDIVIHVANHGTYHRAQIAALLRAGGTTPPYTDYIEGVRRGRVTSE